MSRQVLTDSQRELVESQLWVGRWVANRFRRRARDDFEFDDFLAAAYLGLCYAAMNFDVERGFRFVTFAQWYCFWEIKKIIYDRSVIRVPRGHNPLKFKTIEPRGQFDVADRAPELIDLPELTEAIKKLTERERFLMERMREGYRESEVAVMLGISRERIRQIKETAFARLRRKFTIR